MRHRRRPPNPIVIGCPECGGEQDVKGQWWEDEDHDRWFEAEEPELMDSCIHCDYKGDMEGTP